MAILPIWLSSAPSSRTASSFQAVVFSGQFCFYRGPRNTSGDVAKWLGTALQKRLRRFEPAHHLQKSPEELVKNQWFFSLHGGRAPKIR